MATWRECPGTHGGVPAARASSNVAFTNTEVGYRLKWSTFSTGSPPPRALCVFRDYHEKGLQFANLSPITHKYLSHVQYLRAPVPGFIEGYEQWPVSCWTKEPETAFEERLWTATWHRTLMKWEKLICLYFIHIWYIFQLMSKSRSLLKLKLESAPTVMYCILSSFTQETTQELSVTIYTP